MSIDPILNAGPVIAVATLPDARRAVEVARALVAGGVRAIEVTLRTEAALDAIRAIAAEVEGALVGAGTVLSEADLKAAVKAGAAFAVSPGMTPALWQAAKASPVP
ncbi:MAG TPA: keto-deoxy-phosphogluconate aldolase, partial [Caulobacteraceae bacterium]